MSSGSATACSCTATSRQKFNDACRTQYSRRWSRCDSRSPCPRPGDHSPIDLRSGVRLAVTAAIIIQIFRFGFLLLLWLFLYSIFRLMRADLSGPAGQRRLRPPAGGARGRRAPRPRAPRVAAPRRHRRPAHRHKIKLGSTHPHRPRQRLDPRAHRRLRQLPARAADQTAAANGSSRTSAPPTAPTWTGSACSRSAAGPARRRRSASARPSWSCGRELGHDASLRTPLADRGLIRENNQDSVYAGPRLLAVADGMGGHAGRRRRQQGRHRRAGAPRRRRALPATCCDALRDGLRTGSEHLREVIRESPRARGHGHDADRDAVRRRAASRCATSATPARTCCATASSPRSPTTTRSSRRSSTRAGSPRKRPARTRSAR